MTTASNPTVNADATMKAMAYSGFPASNLVHLYDELMASDDNDEQIKAYRELFQEMETHGEVPHERSILSPAAYFTDLVRMVLQLEDPKMADERKLLVRRPDLRDIPLDADHTMKEKPYLEFAIALLRKLQSELNAASGQPNLSVLERNIPVQRAKAYLDSIGVDLVDIVSPLADSSDAIASARLGLGPDDIQALLDPAGFLALVESAVPKRGVQAALAGPELPRVLSQLGVSDDTLDLLLGTECTIFALTLQNSVSSLAEMGAVHFARQMDELGGFSWYLRQAGGPALDGQNPVKPRAIDETDLAAYQGVMAEILRFSYLANSLGISPADLEKIGSYFGAAAYRGNFLTTVADIVACQKRFDLDIEDAALLWGNLPALPAKAPNGDKTLLGRLFPAVVKGQTFKTVTAEATATAGISQQDAAMIIHYLTAAKSSASATASAASLLANGLPTFAALYRTHKLADLLKVELVDLLSVAKLLGTDLFDHTKLVELVDYMDWVSNKKIKVEHLLAMAQEITEPTCTAADYLFVYGFVQSAIAAAKEGDSDDGEVIVAALASHYTVTPMRMSKLLSITQFSNEMLSQFSRVGPKDVNPDEPLILLDSVAGFCHLQRVIASTNEFVVSDTLLASDSELAKTIGLANSNRFCNIRDLRAVSRLKDMGDVRGIDFAAHLAKEFKTPDGKDAALARILGLTDKQVFKMASLHSPKKMHSGFQILSERGNTIEAIGWIDDLLQLAKTLGVDVAVLIDAASLCVSQIGSNQNGSPDIAATKRTEDVARADAIRNAVKAHDAQAWAAHRDNIEGPFLETERDQLLTAILWAVEHGTDSKTPWPFGKPATADDLSEILLVDVQMGGASKISEIKLALNSLQRYIQRVLTGKEGMPVPLDVDEGAWTWRSHYRLWESNRKTFLFPENYLDPGLRRRKTPLFKDLEDALLQVEIDDDTVTSAYLDYIDKLEQLTHLEIAGVCPARIPSPGSDKPDNVALVLGRTEGVKPDYYHRHAYFEGTDQLMFWHPWEKVTLPIHSREVVVGFANGRIYLLWLEERVVTDQQHGERVSQTFATLNYSCQLHRRGWSPARVWEDFEDQLIGTVTITKAAKAAKAACDNKMVDPNKIFTFAPDSPEGGITFKVKGQPPKNLDVSLPLKGAGGPKGPHFEARLHGLMDMALACGMPEPEGSGLQTWAMDYGINNVTASADFQEGSSYSKNEDNEVVAIGRALGPRKNSPDFLLAIVRFPGSDFGDLVCADLDTPQMWNTILNEVTFDQIYTGPNREYTYMRDPKKNLLYRHDLQAASVKACAAFPDANMKIKQVAVGEEATFVGALGETALGHTAFYISNDGGETWTDPTNRDDDFGHHFYLAYGPSEAESPLYVTCRNPSDDRFTAIVIYYPNGERFAYTMVLSSVANGAGHIDVLADGSLRVCAGDNVYHVTGKRKRGQKRLVNGTGLGVIDRLLESPYGGYLARIFDSRYVSKWYHAEEGGNWQLLDGKTIWSKRYLGQLSDVVATVADGPLVFATKRRGLQVTQLVRTVARTEVDCGEIFQIASPLNPARNRLVPMASNAVHELGRRLAGRGLAEMLSLASQTDKIDQDAVGKSSIDFRPSAAFSEYYREVFFHIPYLIADTLNAHGQFEKAQKWYEYIFCPTLIGANANPDDKTPYWRFAPFKTYELKHLKHFDPEEFTIYEKDPFDAHAIAAIRMGAYEKAVVMRYIDNLLDWGDQLFAQGSWESITQAMNHYNLARDLLGTDPRGHASVGTLPKVTSLGALFPEDNVVDVDPHDTFHTEDRKTFPLPGNAEFAGYWTRTADRLHKIRASEDIRGAKRSLALFQPPIDPRVIMAALSSGMSLRGATGAAANARPQYRYATLHARAKAAAEGVVSLGNALQSTLEKKDAEGLAKLRANHDGDVQKEVGTRLEMSQKTAQDQLDVLGKRKSEATQKKVHFETLKHGSLLAPERLAMKLKNDGLVLSSTTAALRSASAAGYAVPCIFGFSNGGQNIGKVIETSATAIEAASGAIGQSAGLAESRGQNDRRVLDWDWQIEEAKNEIDRVDDQKKTAQLALDRANKEIELHQSAVARSDAMAAYISDKFTNKELYTWLGSQLILLVSGSYQLALNLAKDAEAAHKWERCDLGNHISAPAISSTRGNLMAGQELLLSLERLQRANMDHESQRLQFKKTISLATSQPSGKFCDDWSVIHKGSLMFTLPEEAFAADGAGNAHRRIRSIAITLPAIVGPYQSISAILQQTEHSILIGDKVSLVASGETVAISSGVNDHGVHELDFKSETYQPFEGTGAFSHWHLSLSDDVSDDVRKSISDVIIHIEYVAHKL